MDCPACASTMVAFPVSAALGELLPDDRPGAAICPHCLTVVPEDDPPPDIPDFTTVSDAFPRESDRAVLLAVVVALLDSPATYRRELETVVDRAESRGVDVLLFLDRLGRDPDLSPHFDVDRRGRQLEQLLT
ncbi:MAG: DUF6276 family protein [Halobacteriaceae archaeon]